MAIKGYVDYQRREYCKDIQCPIQLELESKDPGSNAYQQVRSVCQNDCRHTTYEFHHWLIDQGYLIVRPVDD